MNARSAPVAALLENEQRAGAAITELAHLGVMRAAIGIGVRSGKRLYTLAETYGATPLNGAAERGGVFTEIVRVVSVAEEPPDLADELMERGIDEARAEYFDRELKGERVLLVLDAADVDAERLAVLAKLRADLGLANAGGVIETIPLRKEIVEVSKEVVVDNEVTIRTEVVTEHRVIELELLREEVVIERRSLTGEPPQVIRIPTKHEEVRIEKETVVTGEVVVRTDQFVETVAVEEEIRHETVRIDDPREAAAGG